MAQSSIHIILHSITLISDLVIVPGAKEVPEAHDHRVACAGIIGAGIHLVAGISGSKQCPGHQIRSRQTKVDIGGKCIAAFFKSDPSFNGSAGSKALHRVDVATGCAVRQHTVADGWAVSAPGPQSAHPVGSQCAAGKVIVKIGHQLQFAICAAGDQNLIDYAIQKVCCGGFNPPGGLGAGDKAPFIGCPERIPGPIFNSATN